MMESRISIITLGVKNLSASRKFYEDLGFKASSASQEKITFFHMQGTILALFSREELAHDAMVKNDGAGFDGLTIAHNVRTKEEVAKILKHAQSVGAKIVKEAQDVFWGGHSGYFADLDGHLWEIAWNPFIEIDTNGQLKLP